MEVGWLLYQLSYPVGSNQTSQGMEDTQDRRFRRANITARAAPPWDRHWLPCVLAGRAQVARPGTTGK